MLFWRKVINGTTNWRGRHEVGIWQYSDEKYQEKGSNNVILLWLHNFHDKLHSQRKSFIDNILIFVLISYTTPFFSEVHFLFRISYS